MKDSHGQTEQCGCVHWYPRLEDREKCPLHKSAARPRGHDYWDGGRCVWLEKPVWPSQKSWVDDGQTALCQACHCPIEQCLERKSGWKHIQPWLGNRSGCGGRARPATIVQDYREYTAEEILHGIVKFTEQAGWGDPANLGHWLGAAQRWAKERV